MLTDARGSVQLDEATYPWPGIGTPVFLLPRQRTLLLMKYLNLYNLVLLLGAALLAAPAAFAQGATIDRSNNIWGARPADFRPQLPTTSAGLRNCRGAVITSGSCSNYSIENAVGDGLTVKAIGAIVSLPQIVRPSGNGITLDGTGCIINGGIIDGAGGVGILVTGTGNIIKNITIVNCSQPIVVNGVGNIIDWSTIHSTRDAWESSRQEAAQTEAAAGMPVRSSVQTYGTVRAPNIQTYGTVHAQSSSGAVGVQAAHTEASSQVQGKLLHSIPQPVQLQAKQQTLQSVAGH